MHLVISISPVNDASFVMYPPAYQRMKMKNFENGVRSEIFKRVMPAIAILEITLFFIELNCNRDGYYLLLHYNVTKNVAYLNPFFNLSSQDQWVTD